MRSSGLDTTKLKLFAFMVSAFVAGVGGALYIHYLGSIAPRGIFDINFLFTILIAALIGGASTIIGPIMGAFFLTFLLEYLRPYIPGTERYFIYGAIALVARAYPELPLGAPPWAVGAAVVVALLTGLVFGVLPARRAARLDPVAALARR